MRDEERRKWREEDRRKRKEAEKLKKAEKALEKEKEQSKDEPRIKVSMGHTVCPWLSHFPSHFPFVRQIVKFSALMLLIKKNDMSVYISLLPTVCDLNCFVFGLFVVVAPQEA